MGTVCCYGATRWLATGLLFIAAGASGQDMIIESNPAGQNSSRYREISGKWMDSRTPPSVAKSTAPGLTAPGVCGTRKTVFSGPNVETTAPASARFIPGFSSPGHYHVYVTWPRAANASPVRYVISHAGGTTEKTLAQNGWGAPPLDCNAGTWLPLGDYDFTEGTDQYVEVRSEPGIRELDPRWYGQVYADAVRFTREPLTDPGTPLEPEAPPAPQGKELPLQVRERPLTWETELEGAQSKAQAAKKNILLFFFQPGSPGTASIEQKLLSRPEIRAALEARFVLVRLNMERERELGIRLGVFRANILNLYTPQGDAVAQLTDDNTPEEFLEALRKL